MNEWEQVLLEWRWGGKQFQTVGDEAIEEGLYQWINWDRREVLMILFYWETDLVPRQINLSCWKHKENALFIHASTRPIAIKQPVTLGFEF